MSISAGRCGLRNSRFGFGACSRAEQCLTLCLTPLVVFLTSGFHRIVVWPDGLVKGFAVSSLQPRNKTMVMEPRDRKAARRAELVRGESSMKVRRLGSVRVVQEATKEPWGLGEVEGKIREMQDNWANTYEHRRGYRELCRRRDEILGKGMRMLGEQSIAKNGKPHYRSAEA